MAKGRQKIIDGTDVEEPGAKADDRNMNSGAGFENEGQLAAAQKYHGKELTLKSVKAGNVSSGAGVVTVGGIKIPLGEFDSHDHAAFYFTNSRLSATISLADNSQKSLFKGNKPPKVNATVDSRQIGSDGSFIGISLSMKKTEVNEEHVHKLAYQQIMIIVKRQGQAGDPDKAA